MDDIYLARCLDLASKGLGFTAPNPMVGCVIVHDDRIIGEGYHRAFGKAHAEVNALASVKDVGLLHDATLYVNLEPCAHFGKTPPCSDMIIDSGITRVRIGTSDPNPLVGGKGISRLKKKGLDVVSGILQKECLELNKRFFTFHQKKRPFVLLKWARTKDGFIDRERHAGDPEGVNWISGKEARQWVHKWRSEEEAILVGTNTAALDNPGLTVRHWQGRNPLRLVIDREGKLPDHLKLFNGEANTLIFTNKPKEERPGVTYIKVPDGHDYITFLLDFLYNQEKQSLLVEGGAALLKSFIEEGLWDEARVFTGDMEFGTGVPSPELNSDPVEKNFPGGDLLEIYRNA
ncbi:bifunctional diaminohydroxyphosphoribosylaminopyrimidine deaminase/5-amino-6-(5-phosphoribosylamino)uracil reductase RibD [Bacteroidota bacterium]